MWIGGIAPLVNEEGKTMVVLLTIPKHKSEDGKVQRPQVKKSHHPSCVLCYLETVF